MIKTGRFQSVDLVTGLWVVQVDQNGRVIKVPPFVLGGNYAGLEFIPSPGDILLIDSIGETYAIVLGMNPGHNTLLQSPVVINGKLVTYNLQEGEIVIYTKSSAYIYIDQAGNIQLHAGQGGKVTVSAKGNTGATFPTALVSGATPLNLTKSSVLFSQ